MPSMPGACVSPPPSLSPPSPPSDGGGGGGGHEIAIRAFALSVWLPPPCATIFSPWFAASAGTATATGARANDSRASALRLLYAVNARVVRVTSANRTSD